MLYFAYGSNMLTARIRRRVPSAEPVGSARLPRHVLRFHKVGRDGSAKCDAHETEQPGVFLRGVLFRISPEERHLLDLAEGLGSGYDCKTVKVTQSDGTIVTAFTYFATHVDAELVPFDWYKAFVIEGAREHGLPDVYLSALLKVPARPDANAARHAENVRILGFEPPQFGAI